MVLGVRGGCGQDSWVLSPALLLMGQMSTVHQFPPLESRGCPAPVLSEVSCGWEDCSSRRNKVLGGEVPKGGLQGFPISGQGPPS